MSTTTTSSSAALAVIEPAFSEPEKLALAGFLAGYSGMTREAYALDLRQFTAWYVLAWLEQVTAASSIEPGTSG